MIHRSKTSYHNYGILGPAGEDEIVTSFFLGKFGIPPSLLEHDLELERKLFNMREKGVTRILYLRSDFP
jgi:hypothetical protein